MDQKINYDKVIAKNNGILFRGNSQARLEEDLFKSWVREESPIYRGNARSENNGEKITFVTSDLYNTLAYSLQHFGSYGPKRNEEFFTDHPIIIAINAEPYKDKIYDPKHGEGVYIAGDINEKDMVPVIGLNIDNFFKFMSKEQNILDDATQKRMIKIYADKNGFSKKSFIERYNSGQINKSSLKNYLSNSSSSIQAGTESFEKLDQAAKNLDKFLKKTNF